MTVNTYRNNKIYKHGFIKHGNLSILDFMNEIIDNYLLSRLTFFKFCSKIYIGKIYLYTILYINKNVILI